MVLVCCPRHVGYVAARHILADGMPVVREFLIAFALAHPFTVCGRSSGFSVVDRSRSKVLFLWLLLSGAISIESKTELLLISMVLLVVPSRERLVGPVGY